MKNFSIIHPTARTKPSPEFPRGWRDAIEAFVLRADHPEQLDLILVVHESRWEDVENEPREVCGVPLKIAINRGRDCEVDQLNVGAACSMGSLLMGIQDDLFPPDHWDTAVWKAAQDQKYPRSSSFVLGFSTQSPHDGVCVIAGACSAAWYSSRGYILHPDYQSIGSDNELLEDAKRRGVFVPCPDIVFEHRSPSAGAVQADEIWKKYRPREVWRKGQVILDRRRAAGFPQKSAFQPGETIILPPSVTICMPGESFHALVVSDTLDMYGKLRAMTDVELIMQYCSNVYSTRQNILNAWEANPTDLLLWKDDDNVIGWERLRMLFQDLETHPELDAVCGWCWCGSEVDDATSASFVSCGHFQQREGISPDFGITPLNPREILGAVAEDRLLGVDWTGFPVVLMRASCIKKAGENPFHPILDPNVGPGFIGEDIAFCHRAVRLGGARIAVDPRVQVAHLKTRPLIPMDIQIGRAKQKLQAQQDRKESAAAAPCAKPAAAAPAAAYAAKGEM
jgi:hypothetical protein